MKFILAVLVGRVVRFIGQFIGRSTNLPGSIALRICPDLLSRMIFDGKVIAVTGSNGKTTTSNMIAHTLRKQGYSVAINTEGSNLTPGIATTLLCACRLNRHVPQDYIVLETDERFTPIVFSHFVPDVFVVNNLFRDQVVRNGHPDIVYDRIAAAVHPGMTMVVNANDPISQRLAENSDRVYFGMERTSRSAEQQVFLTDDCKVCPKCFHKLRYHYYHYNHIGDFYCEHCGFKTPEIDFLATDVDFEAGTFKINGQPASVTYKTTFHTINATAAVAACVTAGLTIQQAIEGVATFQVSNVRYDEMTLCGRKAVLMLTKQNSASLDQSISYALEQPEEKTVLLYVNNVLYSGFRDISWLYDVTFERMKGKVDKIVCSGDSAYDLAVRLREGGFADSDLVVVDELGKAKEMVENNTKGALYILAASAFGNEDGILEALK